MTIVAPGPFGVDAEPRRDDPVRRGVKRFLASPNFMGASFTTAYDVANTEKALDGFSGATIGLIATGSMSHALVDHLKRGKLGNAKFVDATDLVDAIMVIKSDEEIAAIRATAAMLKPGASCAAIWNGYNEFMRKHGRPEEKRLHCHGQGYHLVERPLVRFDEPMKLAARMNLAVHPMYHSRDTCTWICDNFLITDNGAEPLHAHPQRIVGLG